LQRDVTGYTSTQQAQGIFVEGEYSFTFPPVELTERGPSLSTLLALCDRFFEVVSSAQVIHD
jgi:hypothetical protein